MGKVAKFEFFFEFGGGRISVCVAADGREYFITIYAVGDGSPRFIGLDTAA